MEVQVNPYGLRARCNFPFEGGGRVVAGSSRQRAEDNPAIHHIDCLTFVPLHLERLAFEREGAGLRVVAGGLGGLYGHGIYLLFGCLDGRAVDDVVVA